MTREVLMIGFSFIIGGLICAALLYPILVRHFRYMDAHPRWYER